MPYVRCGKCVYKGKKCSTKGKKVGCSDSPEKAEKYIKALYANVPDAKSENIMNITKKELIELIKEELEVILTNDEAKEMFDIDVEEHAGISEGPLDQTAPLQALERTPTVSEPAIKRADAEKTWRKTITKAVQDLMVRIEVLEEKINLI